MSEAAAPPPRRRRMRHDERRQAIIETTLACLARDGAEGTSLRSVCRELGVAPSLRHPFLLQLARLSWTPPTRPWWAG